MFLATITLRVFFVFLFIRPQIQSVKPGPLMWNSKAQKTDATLNFQSFFNFHPQLFFNPVPCHPPVNQRSKPVFFTAPQSAWRYFARTRKYHRGRKPTKAKARGANSWRKAPKRSWTQKNTWPPWPVVTRCFFFVFGFGGPICWAWGGC